MTMNLLPTPISRAMPAAARDLLPGAVLAAATLCGAIAVSRPLLAAALAVAFAGGVMFLLWPGLAAFTGLALLYSNVAVVAVRFHGVPRWAGIAVALLLAIPLVHALMQRRDRVVLHPVLALLVAFLGVNVVGAAFAPQPRASWNFVLELALEGIAIFFLVTNAVRTPVALRHATWAILLGGALVALVPLYQQVTGSFDDDFGGLGQTTSTGFRTGAGDLRQPRLSGTIGEQNRFAQNMLMLLPLGLALWRIERTAALRRAAILCTALAGAGCALAFSRGAAVAFAITLVTAVGMRLVPRRQAALVVLGGLLCVAAMPQYWKRLSTIATVSSLWREGVSQDADGAVKGRVTEMIAAAMVFADHPLVGIGPGMFGPNAREYGNSLNIRRLEGNRKAHSLYLGIAAENGALGLACFAAIVLLPMRALLRARLRAPGAGGDTDAAPETAELAGAYFLAMVAYLASGLFLHIAYIRFFYVVLGLSAAAGAISRATAAAPPRALPEARPQADAGPHGAAMPEPAP
jgi:O-antigen ligase